MKRRAFLGLAGALALPGCTPERSGVVQASRLPLPRPFSVPLPIPAVAQPVSGSAYELVQRPSKVEMVPGTRTEVWGYNGTFPGPTFDVRAGRPITVAVDDALQLPKGDKDIPLLICDRAFDADGSFLYPSLPGRPGVRGEYHQGVEGDVILVNGAPWPELEVHATRYACACSTQATPAASTYGSTRAAPRSFRWAVM